MDLQQLQEQVDKDIKLNSDNLDIESLKIPELHNKYLKFHNRFTLLLKKAETDFKELYKHKWEYYGGKSSPEVYKENPFDLKVLKSELFKLKTPLNGESLKREFYKWQQEQKYQRLQIL